LSELGERDREAILLRFMEGGDFEQVGAKLALSANAARMRVDRAVGKLRTVLARRGVTSSAAALAAVLINQSVVAAPAGLVTTVTGAALVGAGAGSGVSAALTFMSLTKIQIGLTSAVLVAGAGFYLVQEKTNLALRHTLTESASHSTDAELAGLREKNRQLSDAAREAAALSVNDAELVRLHAEAARVQSRLENSGQAAQTAAARARSPREVFDLSQLDQIPKLKVPVQPRYPYMMSRAGISGQVTVEFQIDDAGKVAEAHVVRSSQREFEEAALAAINQWKFDPGRKDGRMVNTQATQVIEFKLDAGPAAPLPDWF
jgi:TonB family protein